MYLSGSYRYYITTLYSIPLCDYITVCMYLPTVDGHQVVFSLGISWIKAGWSVLEVFYKSIGGIESVHCQGIAKSQGEAIFNTNDVSKQFSHVFVPMDTPESVCENFSHCPTTSSAFGITRKSLSARIFSLYILLYPLILEYVYKYMSYS